MSDPQIVALGGGHGLSASLKALRRITPNLSAIVTVADNGGSSGRLRDEFGVLPPGDLRMALAALCGDDRWGQTWAQVLQHRFKSDGELDGHSLGNLLIVALWELLEDQVEGLDWVADLLDARGRVLPMSRSALEIVAEVTGVDPAGQAVVVRGQKQVASTTGTVRSVWLEPESPPACTEALNAVAEADYVVMGPGSWYTSVIPHLLVPELRAAIATTPARLIVTLNLESNTEETRGFDAGDHLLLLKRYAPELPVDTILVDPSVLNVSATTTGHLEQVATDMGAALVVADVASPIAGVHDPEKLAAAYAAVVVDP